MLVPDSKQIQKGKMRESERGKIRDTGNSKIKNRCIEKLLDDDRKGSETTDFKTLNGL